MNKLITSLFTVLALTFISTSALADPVGDPIYHTGGLYPEQSVTYYPLLSSNEQTRVIVRGDGDGDIDCYMYDENAHLVASDTDSTDSCLMDVYPRWSGVFVLLLTNHGSIGSNFWLKIF